VIGNISEKFSKPRLAGKKLALQNSQFCFDNVNRLKQRHQFRVE